MEKTKKIKTFIGLSYLILVCLFLYFFFSKFSLQDLTSYDFIKQNRSYFFELKKSNFTKVKELNKKFKLICSSLCPKISLINERLKNFQEKNDS